MFCVTIVKEGVGTVFEFGHGHSHRSKVHGGCWGKIGQMEAVFPGVEKSPYLKKNKTQKPHIEKLRRGYWIVSKGNIGIYVFFLLFIFKN